MAAAATYRDYPSRAAHSECADQSGADSRGRHRHAFENHQAQDIPSLSADRDSNTDFVVSLRHGVMHDPIDPYTGEYQCDQRKQAQKPSLEAARGDLVT